MAYGFFSKNESSEFQISESYQNYIFHSSGTVSNIAAMSNYQSSTNSYVIINSGSAGTNVASDDLVFWYADRAFYCGGVCGEFISNASTSTMNASYVRFVKGNSAITPGSGYGIEVFDSSGNPVFSSNYAPLKVNSTSSQAVTVNTASGSGVYVMGAPSSRPYNVVRASISTGYITYPTFSCTGNGSWSWTKFGIRKFTVTSNYIRSKPYYFLSA